MKKLFVIFLFLMLIFPVVLLAQEGEEIVKALGAEYAIVLAIVGIWGLGIVGIMKILKNLFKVEKWAAIWKDVFGYVGSLALSLAGTIFVLQSMGKLKTWTVALYTVLAWMESNGLFKELKAQIKKYA